MCANINYRMKSIDGGRNEVGRWRFLWIRRRISTESCRVQFQITPGIRDDIHLEANANCSDEYDVKNEQIRSDGKIKVGRVGGVGRERGVSSSMDPTSIKVLKVEHGISPSYIPQRPPRSSA